MSAVLSNELQREAPRLERAELLCGHRFRDRALLLRALTHRTYGNESATAVDHNESLELLGDAVLSLVIIAELMGASPGADEGTLSDRRAAHVSEPALARAADRAGLPELLRASRGVTRAVPISARADMMEAVFGAVFLDAGLEAARACVSKMLGPPPERADAPGDNPKRALQERLQRVLQEAPRYEVERDGPSHAPTFRARALLRGRPFGEGSGPSKQAATEAAASATLATLPIDDAELRALLEPGIL